MNIPGLALRNLIRRPARSLLAGTGIAVAVGSFVALTGLSRSIERAFVDTYVQRESHLIAVRTGAVEIMSATLDESLAASLAGVNGVSAVAGELYDLVATDLGDSVLVAGWPAGSYLWGTVRLREGRMPAASEPDAILIGDAVTEALGATTGSRVTLSGQSFHVVGIFSGDGAIAGKTAVVPLATLQRLLGRDGKVTVFNLRVANAEDRTSLIDIRGRLARAFPGLRFSLAGEIGRDNGPLQLFDAAVWAVSTTALLIALFVVVNTLLVSVTERRREVGVLAAVGWSGMRITGLVLAEGMGLAGLGGLAGALIGMATLLWLAHTSVLRGFVKPVVGLGEALQPLLAILALGCFGSLYPAWRATRVPAIEALRRR